ncbi:putative bifunctional diguanylate cyclase/phosphodiesterase [Mesobacillus maritimus]|uniref:Bifunctional diguanylate cyclase/phosphodiesterase n=1 Tax=Mesobacillus maritimus TaxID=1643336 RepID=A0ABS7JZ86_9BACI|nr:bifunctional diguanylate cyclase/phosphodiesterase [Mesobacillus maritimus]MBY0095298.1 bifunctional diguanylate cyclase/phosphodiesterase [Mesobacillus maritimus]
MKMEIIMAKTFSCVYEHDVQLESFLKEHGLMDVPNLLIQISSRNECHNLTVTKLLNQHFPSAIIIQMEPEGGNLPKSIVEEKTLLSFTLLDEKIFKFAYYDLETGLANKIKFAEHLKQLIGLATPKSQFVFALLIIDVDQFKYIIESLGYAAGDFILKQLALRLKRNIPKESYLGRFTGDKFSLLITTITNPHEVLKLATIILERMADPFVYGDQEVMLTASIGISIYPKDGLDEHSLLRNADTAMNKSKQLGGNKITFYEAEMKRKILSRFELENSLRKALKRNEFFLCYQPLMDLETGHINANEALLRWNHPQLGLVSPAEFIPLAEEIGLIDEIGLWVLNEACRQTKKWQQKGMRHLGVSVNVSGKQLQNPAFFQEVRLAIKQSRLNSTYLTLELTESAMIQKLNTSIRLLKALQKTGVRISIDDFGTGYSSLSYLRRLPINSLKIDRSFIKNIQAIPTDKAIVKAIITMGEGLEVDIIAEGVETREQADILRDLRCDYAQGYFIQKPLVSQEFEVFANREIYI